MLLQGFWARAPGQEVAHCRPRRRPSPETRQVSREAGGGHWLPIRVNPPFLSLACIASSPRLTKGKRATEPRLDLCLSVSAAFESGWFTSPPQDGPSSRTAWWCWTEGPPVLHWQPVIGKKSEAVSRRSGRATCLSRLPAPELLQGAKSRPLGEVLLARQKAAHPVGKRVPGAGWTLTSPFWTVMDCLLGVISSLMLDRKFWEMRRASCRSR